MSGPVTEAYWAYLAAKQARRDAGAADVEAPQAEHEARILEAAAKTLEAYAHSRNHTAARPAEDFPPEIAFELSYLLRECLTHRLPLALQVLVQRGASRMPPGIVSDVASALLYREAADLREAIKRLRDAQSDCSPFERRRLEARVALAEGINDPRPAATVCEAFGIDGSTLRKWQRRATDPRNLDDFHPQLAQQERARLIAELMQAGARHYRELGEGDWNKRRKA